MASLPTSSGNSLQRIVVPLALGVVFLVVFTAQAVRVVSNGWATTYDDAFISFRYAQHLAEGHGLVWNVGESPTEGFSNLLLVVAIAVPIRWDVDPLIAARAMSLMALVCLAIVLYSVARRHFALSRSAALVPAGVLVISPAALSIALIGMETTLYALALLLTVVLGVQVIRAGTFRNALLFSLAGFASVLLRPDGALVLVVVILVGFIVYARRGILWSGGLWSLLALAVLLIPYAVWKVVYFGDLLPNPYYIKSGSLGASSLGLASVETFFGTYLLLLLMGLIGTILTIRGRENSQGDADGAEVPRPADLYLSVGWVLIVCTLAYFATTDTLMDIEGRFLFPLVPIVALLGIPTYAALRRLLGSKPLSLAVTSIAALGSFFLLVAGLTTSDVRQELRGERWTALLTALEAPRTVNPHWDLAERLKGFPGIREVRIAYGDAGILPYVTGAPILDPVGLNDSYIARTTDRSSLVDYFFAQRPDLVLLPSDHGGGWITYGHGPLGDYEAWSHDPRWDDYTYVGSDVRTDLPYDLQFLVREDSENVDEFVRFLQSDVTDGAFHDLPWALGTSPGNSSAQWETSDATGGSPSPAG